MSVLDRAGQLVIFEPSPDFAESHDRTFGNALNAIVVPAALGSAEGKGFLTGNSLYGFVGRDEGIPIIITTVDAWAAKANTRVDFIKVDLESYEFEVLKGARTIIQRDRPKIAFTVYHPGNDWREIVFFCPGSGKTISFASRGFLIMAGAHGQSCFMRGPRIKPPKPERQ